MNEPIPADAYNLHSKAFEETVQRFEQLQQGMAAVLMPTSDGWRVDYFSRPTFDEEPGEDFTTLDDALDAARSTLSAINSPEGKERARAELSAFLRRVNEANERRTGTRQESKDEGSSG